MNRPDEPHIPGRPQNPEPPAKLIEARNALSDARISRVGLTTTKDGQWALMVWIPQGTASPVPEIESASGGFPVIYQYDSGRIPAARPAFPHHDK